MDFDYETKQKKTAKRNTTVWTVLGLVVGAGVLYTIGTFAGVPSFGEGASASPFVHKVKAGTCC